MKSTVHPSMGVEPVARVGFVTSQAQALRASRMLDVALASIAGCALSLVLSGYVFGFNNNVFHLPILASLYERPEFLQDAFVQSLRGFASGLWMLLEGSAAWLDPRVLMGVLFAAARLLTFVAMTWMARLCGVRGVGPLTLFAALVAASPSLRGEAYAGQAGLFIQYFSHSEFAAATGLLALAACMGRRFGLALFALGLTFFVNAFMAIWCVPAWLLTAANHYRYRPRRLRRDAPALALGATGAVLLAVPVLWRMAGSGVLADAAGTAFDYRAFLAQLYPYHFFASAVSLRGWAGLAVILAVGWLATRALTRPTARRSLQLMWLGCVAVYAAGVVLPELTGSRVLLNLHLLRSSANLHFLAVVALSVVVVRAFQASLGARRFASAAALGACALVSKASLVGAVPLLAWRSAACSKSLASQTEHHRVVDRSATVACAVMVLVGQLVMTHRQWGANERLVESIDEWRTLARAVAQHAPPGAPVMIPLQAAPGAAGTADAEVFEFESSHPVWVNAKRGAAVMWHPSYHAQWATRMREQAALAQWPQRIAYARAHGIAAVVEACADVPAVFDALHIARAGSWCALSSEAKSKP